MVLFKKRITKALIRLRGCAGWSAPVLFATPEDRFSRDEAHFSKLLLHGLVDLRATCIHLLKYYLYLKDAKILALSKPGLKT